jgi:SAM-dependent methyltransferase
MAHREQKIFIGMVKELYPDYFLGKKVVDFGSLDINGNNRIFFDMCDYTGVDIGKGSNVDVISKAHEYKPNKKFDVVITTEMLEHDMYWEKSLANMLYLLKPNGLLLITCATTGRPEHGTARSECASDSPFTSQIEGWSNYYRNLTIEDVNTVLKPEQNFETYFENETSRPPNDYQFYGIKK